jgi:predicted RNA binding protein YcfA (HicA-like mRNA interferase family)
MPPPSLPIISGSDWILALAKIGYREVRQKGSHLRLVCESRNPVTVPLHDMVNRGTLRSIIRTADIPVDEFVRLL